MKSLKIKEDFIWVGALDPNLRIFDIVMYTEFGSSYNSYILRGSKKTVLFETVKVKFWDSYIEKLREYITPEEIDYVVINHTEPDHSGSLEKLLMLAPNVQIVGSAAAIKFAGAIINKPFNSIIVKDGDTIDLGNKTLQFYMAPFLHWPDSIYTYVKEDKTLLTCDSFGTHYCYEDILLSKMTDKTDYLGSLKYYFDVIMGPYKQHVITAANKIKDLDIDIIAPGHGPVIDIDPQEIIKQYMDWATEKNPNQKHTVIIPYVSAYGYTREMAELLEIGIHSAGDIDVALYDMVEAEYKEVMEKLYWADGILLGSPTMVSDILPPIKDILSDMNPVVHAGKLVSAFGSYGWSGEAVPNIIGRFKQLRLKVFEDGLKINFKPSDSEKETIIAFGKSYGDRLLEKKMK
ncbi:MAG: FprA family A-type flavoprotein [Clostridiales bacterium]|nr:FprA family A-type flavoprotein [Clostridiales bacterium]